MAFCFSGALIFVHDSPVALGQWSPVLGFLFVMMFTFSVHSYDRQVCVCVCVCVYATGPPCGGCKRPGGEGGVWGVKMEVLVARDGKGNRKIAEFKGYSQMWGLATCGPSILSASKGTSCDFVFGQCLCDLSTL